MSKHTWLLAIVFLSFIAPVAAGLATAAAQAPSPVIHENPAKLSSQPVMDVNARLILQLEQMFGSLDKVVLSINASDFDASRLSMKEFDQYYNLFNDSLYRMNLSYSDYQLILEKASVASSDLRAMINSTESYNAGLARFNKYWSEGDIPNATIEAVRLQNNYSLINDTSRKLTASASTINRLLANSSVNTDQLDRGIDMLNTYMDRVESQNELHRSLLGDTEISLNASTDSVSKGDTVLFHARVSSNNTTIREGRVSLYLDGRPADNATVGPDGTCLFYYALPGGSYASTITAIAYYDPQGTDYATGISNSIELTRRPVLPELTVAMTPDTARFGDVVHFHGRLMADGGFPVPGHPVSIALPGLIPAVARTNDDGSYDCDVRIMAQTPSGRLDAQAVYDPGSAPDDALVYASSQPLHLTVLQEATTLTMDQPPQVLHGGENVSFTGTLASASGRPAEGETVSIYAGNILLGNGSTGAAGNYSIAAAVPIDMAAGDYRVCAVYALPGSMSLSGSRSSDFTVSFEAAPPAVVVYGIPVIAFQGDRMDLLANLAAGGTSVEACNVTVNMSGLTIGEGQTDSSGNFYMVALINGSAGLRTITVSNAESGLLDGATAGAGMVFIIPFDLATSLIVLALILAVVGLVLARVVRVRRALSRVLIPRKAPLPRPTVRVAPMPEALDEAARPAVTRFEDEIARIEAIVAGGARDRDAIVAIYLAARRIAGRHGYAIPESATHREFYRQLVAKEPGLNIPTGTITRHYEAAVFGDKRLSEKDIAGSLYSLKEINTLFTESPAGGSV